MVVYPAQTIFLSIVGCKLLQLMRKGFTWKLDQSMRIRIQVLLLEPSSLLMILCGELAVRFHCSSDASVIGLCGYIYKKFMVVVSVDAKVRVYIKPSSQRGGQEHKNACFILHRVRFHCSSDASVIGLCGYIYKKFMVVVSADAKGYRGIAFLDSFFILFASYTDSLYAGARIMEKQHSIMLFMLQLFLIRFHCLLIPAKLPMQLHHVRKTTNIHTYVFTVIDRESKIDPSDAPGRMLDNVKGDIEHCHTLIVNTFSDCSRKTKYFAKIASEEERKMWINGEPSDLR
ncbi:hypothetical protein F2Q69_00010636 [Brassica cretica]|uniref:Uncharacterized protein n=1 Tax=Brassica cretica TaxID=69181 RepID=A0A8S9R051_BRACR|nr:hypothetical protein F2Q69_00010636 [Brassica cretica]